MIVFMTNYLNIHQLPFTLEMYNILGDQFAFISMSGMTESRRRMGFEDLDRLYSFVIRAYEDKEQYSKAESLYYDCEVLIVGSVDDSFIKKRVKTGKLTFRYSERYFKEGYGVKAFLSAMKHLKPFEKYKCLYYLCSSAYTAADLNRYTTINNRLLKWGYFPEVREYSDIYNMILKKEHHSILWCGRMVNWKHPEYAVLLAERLKSEHIEFRMKIVGNGDEFQHICTMVKSFNLSDKVQLTGNLPPSEVRENMERSEIYIFTSDRNEGWGAVLNEAMNSCCATVVSHEIGAAPFLVQNMVNGLIYKDGDFDAFYNCVKRLLLDQDYRIQIAQNAYRTMQTQWNGTIAADRLIKIIRSIQRNSTINLFEEGPCSPAKIINDNWFTKANY